MHTNGFSKEIFGFKNNKKTLTFDKKKNYEPKIYLNRKKVDCS